MNERRPGPSAAGKQDVSSVGLCASCVHSRPLASAKGSTFWRCARSETETWYPKYPRLPVLGCPGYEPAVPLPAQER